MSGTSAHFAFRCNVYFAFPAELLLEDCGMAEILAKRIGEKLRRLRLKQGMSQTLLAERAGITRQYLAHVEHGRYDITVAALDQLCVVLELSLVKFFEGMSS